MKWFARITALLIAVMLAAFVYIYLNLGLLVKTAIETYSPPVLKTAVAVDSVALSPLSGTGDIKNLVIANPEGYGEGAALRLGEVALALNTASLADDVVIIDSVLIDAPELNVVQRDISHNNFKQLLDNINSYDKHSGETTPGPAAADKKLIVKTFTLSNARITITSPLLEDKIHSLTMPTLQLHNLGVAEGGLTPQQLAQVVGRQLVDSLKAQLQQVLEARLKTAEQELRHDAERELKKILKEQLRDLFK